MTIYDISQEVFSCHVYPDDPMPEKKVLSSMEKGDLYNLMIRKGYPQEFSALIASELCTEFTATRMIGYINRSELQPLEEVADEMFAILSDRDRITQKHILEHAQAKINEMYRNQE